MGYSMFLAGLSHHDVKKASPGYTLYTPMSAPAFYLIDMGGNVVHEWAAPSGTKSFYATLLENGNLLAKLGDGTEVFGELGGNSALTLEMDWDGNVVWEYQDTLTHHDHVRRSNGNTIVVISDVLNSDDASKINGGAPGTEADDGTIRGERLKEITPDGQVVWEWRAFDSLDLDADVLPPTGPRSTWLHCNALEELPDGNLLMSFNRLSRLMIIDKSTGNVKWRMNGDITNNQHNPTMLANGNILVFDNGGLRNHSRVIEIVPETQEIAWEYTGAPPDSFFSFNISGAQRLPNGNTLICEGRSGRMFEVTQEKEVVWEFINPLVVDRAGQPSRQVFRAYRYAPDSPEIGGRVGS
jgi:hypothetical protein